MHIAICMDTASERKQLERLLGRSADRRLAEDDSVPFYIQSYGNKQAILARPNMYDLFFIDLNFDTIDSVELIRELRGMGINAMIVLCPNKVDLSDRLTPEDNVYILRQPIIVNELEQIMDIAVEMVKNKIPKIDIRTMNCTTKILPAELLYVEKIKDNILIHIADGRNILSSESLDNFWSRVETYEGLFYLPDNLIANYSYIQSIGMFSVTLKDSRKFRTYRKWIKYMLQCNE